MLNQPMVFIPAEVKSVGLRVGEETNIRELGRNEDLFPWDTAVFDGFPDGLLVAVSVSGIDVSVANLRQQESAYVGARGERRTFRACWTISYVSGLSPVSVL